MSKIYKEEIFTCKLCPSRVKKDDYFERWGQDGYYGYFICCECEEIKDIPEEIGMLGYLPFPDWCPLEDA